jgi:arylsulfatase A-like enzyme
MWLKRHWQIALGCGLGLGGLGQLLVVALARSEVDTSAKQRMAAFVYSAAWLVWIALALALGTAWLLGKRRGRVAAIGLSVLVMTLLAVTLTIGFACRIVSGSYLTAGAVMFTLNSRDHFLHAAVSGYARWAAAIVAVLVAFAAGFARLLGPAARPLGPLPRREVAVCAALLPALAGLYALREKSNFTRGMFVSAPLLALVSSLTPSFEIDRTGVGAAPGEPLAPPGPLRQAEKEWRAAIAGRATSCTANASTKSSCTRPNVLLIMLESLAQKHTGLYGYARPTPEIERLAREGTWWSRAWTTATHSNYAQPAVLSSLFPRRGRGLDQYEELNYPRFLFHDAFHALGYATATVSSQDEKWQGMRRFQDTGTPTFYWFADDYPGEGLDSGVERIAPDEVTTDQALEWLRARKGGPWAMYVNLQATHFPYSMTPGTPRPYQPDEPDWSTFTYLRYPRSDRDAVINRYDNALAHVDRQIGRLRRYLEESGQLDDTLVVMTADHGELFFDREMVTHGRTLYDIESRVPIVMRWPGHFAAERREEPVSHVDILPTVFAALGLPAHPSWQGESVLAARPELVGKRAVYLNIQGLRFADGIVCWPYKLNIDRTARQPHLYDLEHDPDEHDDLIEAQAELAARLDRTLTNQIVAQLDYHGDAAQKLRDERFAPRLQRCPDFKR